MIKLSLILLLAGAFSSVTLAAKAASVSTENLKKFSVQDFIEDAKIAEAAAAKNPSYDKGAQRELKLDAMFSAIEEAAKECLKSKCSDEVFYELSRVTVLTYTVDDGLYASEILTDLYKKHKKDFEKAAKKLSKDDAKLFLQSLKNALRASVEGNG